MYTLEVCCSDWFEKSAIGAVEVEPGDAGYFGFAGEFRTVFSCDYREVAVVLFNEFDAFFRLDIVAEQYKFHSLVFADFWVNLSNFRHCCAAGRAPTGRVEEDIVFGMQVG